MSDPRWATKVTVKIRFTSKLRVHKDKNLFVSSILKRDINNSEGKQGKQ